MRWIILGFLCVSFFCSSLDGGELKAIRIVVGSGSDETTNEFKEKDVQEVTQAMRKAAPDGRIDGFQYDGSTLTVLANVRGKAGTEVFKATHISDCPVNSVFQVQSSVATILIKKPMLKIAEAWCRARHPGGFAESTTLKEATLDETGTRLEVILNMEHVSQVEGR